MERTLILYEKSNGKTPFSDWMRNLKDVKARATIRARLNRIQLGNFGDCKNIGEGVFELRIAYGPGYRVYFGHDGEKIVVLLCGGDKRSQARDIENAKIYFTDYKYANKKLSR